MNADTLRGDAVVVIHELTKKYGSFTALNSLTLSLERGQILGFIGPNGAGKTTTIKILVGLARPSSGTAHIAGADCTRDSRKIKRLVGYMPDTFGSYDNMRVREYLDFFGAAFGIWRKERRKRIDEVMNITGSTYMRDKYVESLSHGMKQRVGVARTLLHDPQVLILDEPAGGLDPQARIEMRELLLQLARLGKTLIVTSHILPDLSRICDRVAIITQGTLRAYGTLEEIMRRVSPLRMMEVQLSAAEQLTPAREIVAKHIEEGAAITVAEAEGAVRFKTARTDDEIGAVLSQLVSAGIRVNQFREVQTDLEDTFLSITRNAEAAEAAPTAAAIKT